MANLVVGCLLRAATVCGQFLQCLIKWLQVSYWISTPRAHPPDTLNSPKWGRHRQIHVHNLKLHYVENGSSNNPLMLFLHGVPDFWYTWRYQLKEFAKDYWTVALDLPGFGLSEEPRDAITYRMSNLARAVCELVETLGKTDCILVGNGCGALLGWHIVNQYPERVSKYIMMGLPSVGILQQLQEQNVIPLNVLLKLAFLSISQSLPIKLAQAGDYAMFTKLLGAFSKPQDLEAYKYTFSQPNALARVLVAFRENWNDFFVEEFEFGVRKTATIPGLYLVGENDHWIRLDEYSPLMVDKYQALETRFVPRTGRYLHQEDPKTVHRIMKEFLGKTGSHLPLERGQVNDVETKVVVKEVCEKCYATEHKTIDKQHGECAKNCDGQEHRHIFTKQKLPICS
uniref:AB hydrolase-1 domain-containing protein n=1 Tax=Anopheles atroparvus TaxID=41427 RepID=A0A182IN78_ANOAO